MAIIKHSVWRCPRCITRIPTRPHLAGQRSSDRNYSRAYQTSPLQQQQRQHKEPSQQPHQAQPLSGYYADLLSTTTATTPTTTPPNSPIPSTTPTPPASTANLQTKEDRARVVFGTRLAGSGYEHRSSSTPDATWRTINGVAVPPRPAEPDNCCMSGCVHCVWDDYRDEVEGWAGRVGEAQAKVRGKMGGTSGSGSGVGVGGATVVGGMQRRGEVADASASMDDDGGGSETNWDGSDPGELFASIPVGIREFMRTEKRLTERRRGEKMKG